MTVFKDIEEDLARALLCAEADLKELREERNLLLEEVEGYRELLVLVRPFIAVKSLYNRVLAATEPV